jgi:SAM-dependent methyltransferase
VAAGQERTGGFGLYFLLGLPGFYRWSQTLVWSRSGTGFFNDYARAVAGERVLDIGCGPGNRLRTLPAVDYTGFDLNPNYIATAQRKYGSRARFFCADVSSVDLSAEAGSFDLVLAHGILHHVDDERAARLFEVGRALLKKSGRLVTVDPCYVPEQSRLSRWVVSCDRGRFVRPRQRYLDLAGVSFSKVASTVRHDLLRIPYSQILLRCTKENAAT